MTRITAERTANVIVAAAAVGVAVAVLRTPSLRRLAWNLTRTAVMVSLPAWVGREVRGAWSASARRAP